MEGAAMKTLPTTGQLYVYINKGKQRVQPPTVKPGYAALRCAHDKLMGQYVHIADNNARHQGDVCMECGAVLS